MNKIIIFVCLLSACLNSKGQGCNPCGPSIMYTSISDSIVKIAPVDSVLLTCRVFYDTGKLVIETDSSKIEIFHKIKKEKKDSFCKKAVYQERWYLLDSIRNGRLVYTYQIIAKVDTLVIFEISKQKGSRLTGGILTQLRIYHDSSGNILLKELYRNEPFYLGKNSEENLSVLFWRLRNWPSRTGNIVREVLSFFKQDY